MRIIGVDFSGAEPDRNTWQAEGVLVGNTLTIENCRRIRRAALTAELSGLTGPAVVGMDFPFSVPVDFANFWCPRRVAQEGIMPDVWATAARLRLGDFRTRRNDFAGRHGEPKRFCDPPESFSCLHNTRPDMLPMTFRGMQMLNRLWQGITASPVMVPPLPQPNRPDEKEPITLLEVMPGAVLNRLGLPFTGYKSGRGQEQREQRRQVRRSIVEQLPERVDQMEVDLGTVSESVGTGSDGIFTASIPSQADT